MPTLTKYDTCVFDRRGNLLAQEKFLALNDAMAKEIANAVKAQYNTAATHNLWNESAQYWVNLVHWDIV